MPADIQQLIESLHNAQDAKRFYLVSKALSEITDPEMYLTALEHLKRYSQDTDPLIQLAANRAIRKIEQANRAYISDLKPISIQDYIRQYPLEGYRFTLLHDHRWWLEPRRGKPKQIVRYQYIGLRYILFGAAA